MKEGKFKRFLSIILIIFMVAAMLPLTKEHAHAASEEWEECIYCNSKRSPDYLCGSCGGCGEATAGSGCYEEHHCPSCDNCEEDYDLCEYCRQCDECVRICYDCFTCTDCIGFDEFCEDCNRCGYCFEGSFCYGCNRCEGCSGGGNCDNCSRCSDCYDYICPGDCGICNECFEAEDIKLCPDCGLCQMCAGEMCGNCYHCSDCATYCTVCEGDYCSACSDLCPECHACDNCVDICVNCGNYCTNCAEFCLDCGETCSNCADFCPGCGEYCNVCAEFCSGCGLCEHCADICQGCGDVCSECGDICPGCSEYCSDCAIICGHCGEACSECSTLCNNCDACKDCVEICPGCGEYCDTCAELCTGCGLCENCAYICQGCGDVCSECGNICAGCFEYCSDCADICIECGEVCSECGEICEGCGEYCSDCRNFCQDCNRCEECVELCGSCQEYCSDCVEVCGDCGECENCAVICKDCGNACEACGSICPECGLCSQCGGAYDDYKFDESCHWHECSCGYVLESEDHRLEGWVIDTPPTAVNDGSKSRACRDCDYVLYAVIPAQHECKESSWIVDLPATTEAEGSRHKECTICGEILTSEVIPKVTESHEHEYVPMYDEAYHWSECSVCGALLPYSKIYHKYKELVTEPATCTKSGREYRDCYHCEYREETITQPATGHTPGEWIVDKKATLTEEGSRHRVCVVCNEVIETEVIPVLDDNHVCNDFSYLHDDVKHWRICNDCGKTDKENAHVYGDWITDVPAACLAQGHKYRICADINCGYIQEEIIEALGHKESSWIIDIPATNEADGSRHKECTRCAVVLVTEVIPKIDENHVCSDFSYEYNDVKHWRICNDCGKIDKENPHSYGDWITDIPAGCITSGHKFRTCNDPNCEYKQEETIAALGHVESSWIIDLPATTSAEGSKHTECTLCGLMLKTEVIPKKSSGSTAQSTSPVSFTLTFDTNGGSVISSLSKNSASVISLGGYTPIKEGFIFRGWYEDSLLTKEIKNITLNKDVTIYAKWTEEAAKDSTFSFSDINKDDWFHDAVEYVLESGIMKGVSDTEFLPYGSATRGMIVTILHRLEGMPETNLKNNFSDVKEGEWYTKAVTWAAEQKIVSGYGNGSFGPEDDITREQLAVILMNYANFKGYNTDKRSSINDFTDEASVSAWAREALSWANAEELIQGGENQLMPFENAQRAQVAAVLQRFINKYSK